MKKLRSFKILKFSFQKLCSKFRNSEFLIAEPDLRSLLFNMIPPARRAAFTPDDTAGKLAAAAAVSVPHNAMFRLLSGLTGCDDKDRFCFLKTLIYVEMDGKNITRDSMRRLTDGLTFCFGDAEEEKIRFVPFERSASQTRSGELVMIAQTCAENPLLEQAISCGVDETAKVNLSKFSAYRALLMTNGLIINPQQLGGIVLNEDSVIVVHDFEYQDLTARQKEVSGVCNEEEPAVCTATIELDKDVQAGKAKNIRYTKKQESIAENLLFDGEGLISAELAERIAAQIQEPDARVRPEKISSFQVRMPYVKGVLHKADFHALFREVSGGQEDLYLTDYYGVRHPLRNIHIILSASMFKAKAALLSMLPKDDASRTKAAEYEMYRKYWAEFHQYGHRLCISNCDAAMIDTKNVQTITNYQFLSTLDYQKEQKLAPEIIRPAMAAVMTAENSADSKIVSYLLRTGAQMLEDGEGKEDESALMPDDAGETITDSMLLMKCPELVRNKIFSDRMDLLSIKEGCSIGRLFTPGCMRYLSGDLVQLAFLLACSLTVKDGNHIKSDALKALCRETLRPAQTPSQAAVYYAPGVPALPAVLNRNPHLSLQEHVQAVPLVPETDSFRQRYFSHLSGVCMVPLDEVCAADRLGGADYDGDLVRIYWDPAYREAAKGGTSLPALKIPALKGLSGAFTQEARRELILKTAEGSRIGSFSNAGYFSSLFAYQHRRCENAEEAEKDIVKLACMTGLETDAAKTGMYPEYNKQDFVFTGAQRQADDKKKDPFQTGFFIAFKDMMKGPQSERKEQEMKPLKTEHGFFSPVEALPYIFMPDMVTMDEAPETVFPLEWVRNYHDLLQAPAPKETRADCKSKKLRDLLTAGETPELTPEQQTALHELTEAVRVYQAVTSRSHVQQNTESKYLKNMRAALNLHGTHLQKQCGAALKNAADRVSLSEEELTSLLSDIVPWRHLENKAMRMSLLTLLMQQHRLIVPEMKKYEELFELDETAENALIVPEILKTDFADQAAFLEKISPLFANRNQKKRKSLTDLAWEFRQALHQAGDQSALSQIADELTRNDGKNWVTMSAEERKEFLAQTGLFLPEEQELQNLLAEPGQWRLLPNWLRYAMTTAQSRRRRHCRRKLREFYLKLAAMMQLPEDFAEAAAMLMHLPCAAEHSGESGNLVNLISDFDMLRQEQETHTISFVKTDRNGTETVTGTVPLRTLLGFCMLYFAQIKGLSGTEQQRILLLNSTGLTGEQLVRVLLAQDMDSKQRADTENLILTILRGDLYPILQCTHRFTALGVHPELPFGYLDGVQGWLLESALPKQKNEKTAKNEEKAEITVRTIVCTEMPDDLQKAVETAVSVPEAFKIRLSAENPKLLAERLRVVNLAALPFEILRKTDSVPVLKGYVTCVRIPECLREHITPLQETCRMPVSRHCSKKQDSERLPYFLYGYQIFRRENTDDV